jgi:hypothetical protein
MDLELLLLGEDGFVCMVGNTDIFASAPRNFRIAGDTAKTVLKARF